MSATRPVTRKIVISATALLFGLSAMFVATGTAGAESRPYSVECDNDWHTPCP